MKKSEEELESIIGEYDEECQPAQCESEFDRSPCLDGFFCCEGVCVDENAGCCSEDKPFWSLECMECFEHEKEVECCEQDEKKLFCPERENKD